MQETNRTARLRRWLRLATALLVPAWATAQPGGDCPPVAQAPSAEQLQAAQRQAVDRGFLWRLSKDGRTSYLYGTIHLGRLAWAVPGPKTLAALREAETIALELDPTDALVQQRVAERLAAAPAPAPSEALRARLARQARAACLPDAVLQQPAIAQALTYTVLAGRRDALDPSYSTESVLVGFARTAGKRLASLETADRQMDALLPRDADESARVLDQLLGQLESGETAAQMRNVAAVWAEGDGTRLAEYASWCGCLRTETERADFARLNDARNPALAAGIEALHGQGQRVFAAVGFLHMTGEKALPMLLAQRGFTVEPVAFGR